MNKDPIPIARTPAVTRGMPICLVASSRVQVSPAKPRTQPVLLPSRAQSAAPDPVAPRPVRRSVIGSHLRQPPWARPVPRSPSAFVRISAVGTMLFASSHAIAAACLASRTKNAAGQASLSRLCLNRTFPAGPRSWTDPVQLYSPGGKAPSTTSTGACG